MTRLARSLKFQPLFVLAVFTQAAMMSTAYAAEPTEPVYRVANEASAAQPAVTASPVAATVPAAAPVAVPKIDLTLQPDEHPLVPVIRVLKASGEHIDQNIHDYSCTLVKQERVEGTLGDKQQIFMKIRQQPFSVYMSFIQPYQGREVVYVAGQNENEMVVLEAGWKRKVLGKLHLDPEGTVAMSGQKYPITQVGMRNLINKLVTMFEADIKFSESNVTSNPDMKIGGRSATMIQIVHPIARQNFHHHVARIFIDNELGVPIHYDAYGWPGQAGQQPPLELSYTYTNLKINNGYTARDFDTENNPDIFKL